MKLAVFGVKDAQLISKQLNKVPEIEICCFSDNNASLWDEKFEVGLEKKVGTISPQKLKEQYMKHEIDAVLIAVRHGYNRWKITRQLQELGIDNIGIVKPSVLTYEWSIEAIVYENYIESDQIVWISKIEKPIIHCLEVHVMDVCNLNCKGCLHFSNLFNQNDKVDIEQVFTDLEKLSSKCFIVHLRVLGGEPLLNNDLDVILKKLRSLLPMTDITVVTNGTLIPKQKKELFQIMKECNIGFTITLYPPTRKSEEKIKQVLEENGVSFGTNREPVINFSKSMQLVPNIEQSNAHNTCVSRNIFFLREGKLHKCPPEALINRFYERFDIPLRSDTGIDIYSDEIIWNDTLNDLYEKPVEQCKFCSEELVDFPWKMQANPEIEDWII